MARNFAQRHYEALAEVLHNVKWRLSTGEYRDPEDYAILSGIRRVEDSLVEMLARDSGRFSEDKFRKAAK